MKILKIFGIVAGLHALALLLIFANPGCSSTTKQTASAASAPSKPESAPVISVPNAGGPSDPASPPAAPITAAPDTPPLVGPFYTPTRPGSPAAAALESQPVSDVIPATTYTVKSGDSLWIVAKKNHLKVAELTAANNLKAGAALRPGQKLVIPSKAPASGAAASAEAPASASAPVAAHPAASAKPAAEGTKHVVKPGETLGTIARKYGVKVGELAMANAISDPQKIHPGQELVIPAGGHPGAGKSSKSAAAKAEAPVPAAVPQNAPAANQDLDSGLKPGSAGDVPVIKIEPAPDQSGTNTAPHS